MNGNQLNNTSKGYLKFTNGPLLKAMNGKELYSVLFLLKKKTVVSLATFVACWVLGKRSPNAWVPLEHKIGENNG